MEVPMNMQDTLYHNRTGLRLMPLDRTGQKYEDGTLLDIINVIRSTNLNQSWQFGHIKPGAFNHKCIAKDL